VYLSPLIEDLIKLWVDGVDVYDAHVGNTFLLHVMIFYTVNDFTAYENLSGYSVKGHHGHPICEKNTSFIQLKHGKKTVYTRHWRFLKHYHPYRRLKKAFNGTNETEGTLELLAGHQVYDRVKDIINVFGKTRRKDHADKNICKKRSVFFDLPYWTNLHVRHCLDVMHVEKNVCDSLIGTLLNIKGKTKDRIKCHQDLVEMGIRHQLHPQPQGRRTYLPPTCYTMSTILVLSSTEY